MTMWNERYGSDEFYFGVEPNRFLVSTSDLLSTGSVVLAIADGEGRNGVWLAEQGCVVTSVDVASVGMAKAQCLATARRVELTFVVADLLSWEWPTCAFDVVVAIFIQFATPDQRREIFGRCFDALVPGGTLLLQGYREEQLGYGTGGPPIRENLYSDGQLRSELARFDISMLRSHDSSIHEGAGHDGMSALADVVARRPTEAR